MHRTVSVQGSQKPRSSLTTTLGHHCSKPQETPSPRFSCQPNITPTPRHNFLYHLQLYCSSPASPGSVALLPRGPNQPSCHHLLHRPHPPPLWLHLLLWLGAHTKPGVLLRASWAGRGGKGQRGAGGQEAASFVTDTPAPSSLLSPSSQATPAQGVERRRECLTH